MPEDPLDIAELERLARAAADAIDSEPDWSKWAIATEDAVAVFDGRWGPHVALRLLAELRRLETQVLELMGALGDVRTEGVGSQASRIKRATMQALTAIHDGDARSFDDARAALDPARG